MSGQRIGSLFSGVGGLDLAVEAFFDAETVWHCEFDPEPSKVLAKHWPGVPNHGDITAVDWSTVEPVDILCGGFPCQDLSLAGRRSGMRPGTRSGLWSDFTKAIAALKPSVVVIENVRGLLSGCAESDSDVEPCPGCVAGERGVAHAPRLRALGRVLGDLDRLGFDAEWHGLPASDVGAPHGRFRVFVLAYAKNFRHERRWPSRDGWTGSADGDRRARESVALLPTPTARDEAASGGNSASDVTLTDAVVRTDFGRVANPRHVIASRAAKDRLLPTPLTTSADGVQELERRIPGGRGSGLLPTPQVADATGGHATRSGDRADELMLPGIARAMTANWGPYTPAIQLWESLTRPAPAPTKPDGKNGNHRLSAEFPEWMMGYPAGWVTDVIGRSPAIKACGNGVVPQQAFAALRITWGRVVALVREETAA